MAVPIEFINVIVRRSSLETKYPGGVAGYERDKGFGTFAMDACSIRCGTS